MPRASLALLLLLAACQRAPTAADAAASDAGGAPASGLERAAIESGAITDTGKTSPVGLYQRSHEAGRDLLCVMPAKDAAFRFGLQANFGEDQSCRGQGTARRAGDKLILSFKGGDRCIVVAQYDGDQVALPGVVDMACADLCEGRGTLEGVSFPRIANDAASALRARDSDGKALCEG
ncbi:MAG: hypothetical protein C0494_11085 [Sphingobium sp.]|uniref:hypothetical protein n=1 Tax=Sphingobium sp. AntQ-1 TaxID=2930091 RepID=UPI00234F4798|nr:hypothetical protein [Sphingobium sp. AntQ-1]MBA4091119.1 hypothetical protein [Sphingobium sp.]WCP11838.1 hypothetical protein sphantq_00231 [Sphingobium sp. AntQ-1]